MPLATAHACIEALGIAERALLLVDPALRCDIEAAVLLLVACVDAVLLNVDADLQGELDDAQARERVQVRPSGWPWQWSGIGNVRFDQRALRNR